MEDPAWGNWRVEDIGLPHEGVLVQDEGDDNIMALVEDKQFSSQTVETDIWFNQVAGGGGLVLWFQDDDNWVVVSMYPAGQYIRVYESIDGLSTRYHYSTSSYKNRRWYTLKAVANSIKGTIDVYVADSKLFTYDVATTNRSGKTGVTSGNSGGYFDNFMVSKLPETKEDCMRGGWEKFMFPSFRNQGQCIKHVVVPQR